MDYSLLVGVHFREVSGSGEPVTTETRNSGVRTPTGIHVSPHSFLLGMLYEEGFSFILLFQLMQTRVVMYQLLEFPGLTWIFSLILRGKPHS